MKIGFLITARLKSSRLPQKLLLDLNGKTIIERVIDRCKKVADISEIILCTSTNAQDKPLVDIALRNKIYYYLGSESDVLERLSHAATFFNLDYIINITGENPLFSTYHANLVVNEAKQSSHDFIFVDGLPIGCAVYGIRPEALKTVCEIKEEIDTEIWGPLINRPDIFNVKKIDASSNLNNSNLRITTDYLEDYFFIQRIFSHYPSDYTPDYIEVAQLLIDKPELTEINKNRKQAQLNIEILRRIDRYFNDNQKEILEVKSKYYKVK
jgi:spore coat polysaccharide biosynthesis protein SpsF